jgi:hypothetical protein
MIPTADIAAALHRLYIAAPGAGLRSEEQKKVAEMAGLLVEIARVARGGQRRRPFALVDAAAGKAYVGLLAAELLFAREGRPASLTLIERESRRAAICRAAVAALRAPGVACEVREADVADAAAWPDEPDLIVALHACGPASDLILARALACRARHLLLVPCCTSAAVPASELAERWLGTLGLPEHAEIRRRFIQSVVDGARTLTLEAAGYETTVVSFVSPTVTPHHLLWRARRVGEPRRMAAATEKLKRLRAPDA